MDAMGLVNLLVEADAAWKLWANVANIALVLGIQSRRAEESFPMTGRMTSVGSAFARSILASVLRLSFSEEGGQPKMSACSGGGTSGSIRKRESRSTVASTAPARKSARARMARSFVAACLSPWAQMASSPSKVLLRITESSLV
jgi:hypothetical protein